MEHPQLQPHGVLAPSETYSFSKVIYTVQTNDPLPIYITTVLSFFLRYKAS